MVFPKTPGGELNRKLNLVRLRFDIVFACFAKYVSLSQGGRKLSGIGKGNVTRKHPKLCRFQGHLIKLIHCQF